jgi:hypothetical protein
VNRRAEIIAANLLVPVGVLAFGWNGAAAVFLIWLDTLLVSLQLGALVFAAVNPLLAPPADTHRGGWTIGVGIGMAFAAPMFFVPPFVVGLELYEWLKPQFPEGPLSAAFADRIIYVWIAIGVLIRGDYVLARARKILQQPAVAASFAVQTMTQLLALMYRMVILIGLAWLSSWTGRPGLLVFLFAAAAFLIYSELRKNPS